MTTLAQDLGGVVRLLEDMTPGDLVVYDANEGDGWPPRPLWCFKNEGYDSGDDPALQGSIHYGGKEDADAIVAAVNFLRSHSAEIAGALRDAERYRWLKCNCQHMPDEIGIAGQLYFGTYAWGDLDTAIDSAMQQGGGGE